MPQVLNYYKVNRPYPPNVVYVGRPSEFGNPFPIVNGIVSRDMAIDSFEKWIATQPELIAKVKRELKGKDLVCFCAPKRCHADVLLKIANED
jgi:hypothetical protein